MPLAAIPTYVDAAELTVMTTAEEEEKSCVANVTSFGLRGPTVLLHFSSKPENRGNKR